MWLRECLKDLTKGLLAVSAIALLIAAVRSVYAFAHLVPTLIVCGCAVIWFVWKATASFGKHSDPKIAARQIDKAALLNNRITTALEVSKAASEPIQQLLIQDAIASVRAIQPANIVALPSAKSPVLATAALLVAISLLLLSPLVTPKAAAQPTIKTSHDSTSLNRLADILKAILEELNTMAEANPSEEMNALIRDTQEALLAIEEGNLSTSEAYLQLSKLQQQMLETSQLEDPNQLDSTWQKVADALNSSQATDSIAELLQSKQFQQAAEKMAEIDSDALAKEKLTPAEVTSLSEKLDSAAASSDDEELAKVLKDLSSAIADGKSDTATQKMQDLGSESAKHQFKLDQAQHLDDLSEQLEIGKRQLAISSNSSGDGQMGGRGLNEETGKSKGKPGADSQKAGAKTAGNIDGPKADLEGPKQLAELQGQFGDEGQVEVKTKSTDERPDFEINRQAQSVLTEYSRQLEADLKRQRIPQGHEEIVRKYFESIRPKTNDQQ